MSTSLVRREEIELVLLHEVERSRKVHETTDPLHHSDARQQYVRALQRFGRLIEDGQLPEDPSELSV